MLIFTYVIEDNMKKTWCKFQDLLSLQKVANEDERFLVSTGLYIREHNLPYRKSSQTILASYVKHGDL